MIRFGIEATDVSEDGSEGELIQARFGRLQGLRAEAMEDGNDDGGGEKQEDGEVLEAMEGKEMQGREAMGE